MTDTPQPPSGRALAVAFLVITVLALAPVVLLGGWWNLLLILAIPAGITGILGLAFELSQGKRP